MSHIYIYVEYILNGNFYQDDFTSWDEYFNAMFSPDIEILKIVVNNK